MISLIYSLDSPTGLCVQRFRTIFRLDHHLKEVNKSSLEAKASKSGAKERRKTRNRSGLRSAVDQASDGASRRRSARNARAVESELLVEKPTPCQNLPEVKEKTAPRVSRRRVVARSDTVTKETDGGRSGKRRRFVDIGDSDSESGHPASENQIKADSVATNVNTSDDDGDDDLGRPRTAQKSSQSRSSQSRSGRSRSSLHKDQSAVSLENVRPLRNKKASSSATEKRPQVMPLNESTEPATNKRLARGRQLLGDAVMSNRQKSPNQSNVGGAKSDQEPSKETKALRRTPSRACKRYTFL